NLNASGPESLREGLSRGDRYIVSEVCGTITLLDELLCKSNVTVDFSEAPTPGITLIGETLSVKDVSNVVLRGFRHRGVRGGEGADGISVYNSQTVVLDHLSVS